METRRTLARSAEEASRGRRGRSARELSIVRCEPASRGVSTIEKSARLSGAHFSETNSLSISRQITTFFSGESQTVVFPRMSTRGCHEKSAHPRETCVELKLPPKLPTRHPASANQTPNQAVAYEMAPSGTMIIQVVQATVPPGDTGTKRACVKRKCRDARARATSRDLPVTCGRLLFSARRRLSTIPLARHAPQWSFATARRTGRR